MKAVVRLLAVLFLSGLSQTWALDSLPAQKELLPKAEKAKVIVLLSGQTGPGNYEYYAQELADKGYYVVLFDGNDFRLKEGGATLLKDVITKAQQSPHALPGKVAVMGFSLGGMSSLAYATRMPSQVATVVVSYPATSFIKNPENFVSTMKVPTLMFAGGRDNYRQCCVIETAHKLAEAAKAGANKDILELIEYPYAAHGWTIKNQRAYSQENTEDGFKRTLDHLRKYLGD